MYERSASARGLVDRAGRAEAGEIGLACRSERRSAMKRPVVKSVVPFFVFAAVVLAGCGSGNSSGASSSKGLPKTIVLGAAIAKSGYLAAYDASISAVEQLVDEINAKGG